MFGNKMYFLFGGSDGKESACSAGDLGSIPGLGRSPGGGHGNPLQYSCLENPMDRGAWQACIRIDRIRFHSCSTANHGLCVLLIVGLGKNKK